MDITEILKKIKDQNEPRATCREFDEVPWVEKTVELEKLGFDGAKDVQWFEVSREDAIGVLTSIISTELCYGSRIMPKEDAAKLAEELVGKLPFETQFYTNSEVPWHRQGQGWSFAPLKEDATIDTGILTRVKDQMGVIVWVADID